METKTITVAQIADMIKADFLYELGKDVINQVGVELLPDTPDNKPLNVRIAQYAAAAFLDQSGIPANAFDHLFNKKAIETFENMMMEDLRDRIARDKEDAIAAMLDGDVDSMMDRLRLVHSMTEILEG